MTNWQAMQVQAVVKRGEKPSHPRPAEVRTRYLSMGSWHADSSAGGQRAPKQGSHSGGGGKAKVKRRIPPVGGWTADNAR